MQLQDIYIYPIKSLGGIRLTTAKVEVRGLQYDRRWMLVDESGMFLSQRTIHRMALLQVSIEVDGLRVFLKEDHSVNCLVPFEPQLEVYKEVTIWEDTVTGQLVSVQVDAWFSKVLDMPCHLVYMPAETARRLKPKYSVNDETVSFADGMPYMVIGQASLDDLNARLDKPAPMDRFRPNFVFSGGGAFAEDEWQVVKIGAVEFKVTKPCARCVMTTVDQATAQTSKEPLKTLATYRTVNNNVMFGQNMIALNLGEVHVGDQIHRVDA